MPDPPESQPEELLAKWLVESDEVKSDTIFGELLTLHAEPVIRSAICRKLGSGAGWRNTSRLSADVDDVCHDALSNVCKHLNGMKAGTHQTALRNFNSYVAATAHNAYNEYFRLQYPARYSLANSLRYFLTHSPEFGLWEIAEGQEAAGIATMKGKPPEIDHAVLESILDAAPKGPERKLLDIALHVFKLAKAPLVFKNLLEIVAHCKGLLEAETNSHYDHGLDRIQATEPSAENGLVKREYLAKLWVEIRDLTLEQKAALLLNLRGSGGGDIQLFAWLGIATVQEIGEALEMAPERFAALWSELPLDDARIASEMGMTRQTVINRRDSARARLASRMKGY